MYEASYYTLTGELYPRLLEKLCEESLNNFDKRLFFNNNELKEKIIAKKENNLMANHDFLSKYCYHLSILNAAKLLDIFTRVVDDEIIIAEKLGKGKISKTRSSYALYYDSNLFNLSNISASTVSFFDYSQLFSKEGKRSL
ncbi:MAG: hypothetical protein HA494_09095 [Thaumarchaeota archaeon]|nr:hypothetical protein [Nitrososphaerota archaeon]